MVFIADCIEHDVNICEDGKSSSNLTTHTSPFEQPVPLMKCDAAVQTYTSYRSKGTLCTPNLLGLTNSVTTSPIKPSTCDMQVSPIKFPRHLINVVYSSSSSSSDCDEKNEDLNASNDYIDSDNENEMDCSLQLENMKNCSLQRTRYIAS